jgi:hypothetical protein
MPNVALLEAYALEPNDWVEDTEPFKLDEDNMVEACTNKEQIENVIAQGNQVTVCEFIKLRSMVLCRDEEGELVFKKLLWKEFTEPNWQNRKGIWHLGFEPKVNRGDQHGVALVLPSEVIIVESLSPLVSPTGKHKNPRKPKLTLAIV